MVDNTFNAMDEMAEYLNHHGIKGQKWGVRRYQNPDGSLTSEGRKRLGVGKRSTSVTSANKKIQDKWRRKAIKQHTGKDTPKYVNTKNMDPKEGVHLKKGDKITHITTVNDLKISDDRILYATYDKQDVQLYKSVLAARIMKHTKEKSVNAIEIELKNNLDAPSREESIQMFMELYNKDRNKMNEHLLKRADEMVEHWKNDDEPAKEKEWAKIKEKLSDGKQSSIENYGYRIFNHDFVNQESLSNDLYKDYISEMKSRGYNALIDDNDSKYDHMGAKVPILLIEQMNTLGNMTVEQIKSEDVYGNYIKWLEEELK